jgi:hypothetical protein
MRWRTGQHAGRAAARYPGRIGTKREAQAAADARNEKTIADVLQMTQAAERDRKGAPWQWREWTTGQYDSTGRPAARVLPPRM